MLDKTICDSNFECHGSCWLNVAGSFDVWKLVSKHCTGTTEERNLIGDVFNSVKSKEEISNRYSLTGEAKITVEGYWGN